MRIVFSQFLSLKNIVRYIRINSRFLKSIVFLKLFLLFIFIIYLNGIIYSQDSLEFNYATPLDLPLSISGNFGDIRDNTFHFGIDFRTNEKEGYPVFAVADGYIWRIKIEPGGYGNAVYINHKNGITSVYAHMRSFIKVLDKFAKNEQYKRHSFKIDIELPADSFKVRQCDTIGFSGTKGLSSGPHLHFELRRTSNQDPMNCLTDGIYLVDSFPPVFTKLWVYPYNKNILPENFPKKSYDIVERDGSFYLNNNDTILIPENSGLGIETHDYITDNFREHSFYSQKLYFDTILLFETVFDEISFEQVGYVNSFIDYAQKMSDNSVIFKLFAWPNQDLMFNKTGINMGLVSFRDSAIHHLKIVLSDANGNYSALSFYAKPSKNNDTASLPAPQYAGTILKWDNENSIQNKFIKIIFPENSLYSNIDFTLITVQTGRLPFPPVSKTFKIGNINIPLKKPIYITFPLENISNSIRNKIVIASINKYRSITSLGGTIEGNYITAQAKFFGTYAMFFDTLPPSIKPLNISNGKNMIDEDSIKFKISDALSGIQDFNGTIDKKWVLFEFDSKNNFLYYAFDNDRFKANQKYHLLELMVSDKKGNTKKYIANFKK